jgi:Holliday junction resolvase RusA-like endonuclease
VIWTLTLDGRLPASMNERERTSHWIRRRELEEITTELGWQVRQQKIPAATGRRFVRVTLHKSLRSRRRDDPANRDSRAKSILDALVKLGVLVDDDDTHLIWVGVVEGEKRAHKQTVIEVGDAE